MSEIEETLEIAYRYLGHENRDIRLMAQITIKYCKQLLGDKR